MCCGGECARACVRRFYVRVQHKEGYSGGVQARDRPPSGARGWDVGRVQVVAASDRAAVAAAAVVVVGAEAAAVAGFTCGGSPAGKRERPSPTDTGGRAGVNHRQIRKGRIITYRCREGEAPGGVLDHVEIPEGDAGGRVTRLEIPEGRGMCLCQRIGHEHKLGQARNRLGVISPPSCDLSEDKGESGEGKASKRRVGVEKGRPG